MPAIYALDIYRVGVGIGIEPDCEPARINLPFMNVQLQIGDEFPTTWPPDVLREAGTGAPLLDPETGETLLIAGP